MSRTLVALAAISAVLAVLLLAAGDTTTGFAVLATAFGCAGVAWGRRPGRGESA